MAKRSDSMAKSEGNLYIWTRIYDDSAECFPMAGFVGCVGKHKNWEDAVHATFSQLGLDITETISHITDSTGNIHRYFMTDESEDPDVDDRYMAIDIINMADSSGLKMYMLYETLRPLDNEMVYANRDKFVKPTEYLIDHIDQPKRININKSVEEETDKPPIIDIDAITKGAAQILGEDINSDEVKAILKCFGFEVDGQFIPLVKMDGEEQVGISVKEFQEKFKDFLIDPDNVMKADNSESVDGLNSQQTHFVKYLINSVLFWCRKQCITDKTDIVLWLDKVNVYGATLAHYYAKIEEGIKS